jgi:pimeloyl-ACP methyl ester carboxylesterase
MNIIHTPAVSAKTVTFGSITVNELNIAYREAGDPSSPKLVLLHGWPASSHQFRDLIPALASRFHVIAPDYPGFGNSDTPDPAVFSYTFDKLAEVTESFLKAKGFEHYGLYVQDYGGPVGFRIMTKNPEALDWLIIQNTNAYEIGFSAAWGGLRNALWLDRSKENEQGAAGLLELDTVKATYLGGSTNPALISPDAWNMAGSFNSTFSTTTETTSPCIPNGRISSNGSSQKRSSSGGREIFSSRPRAAKHTFRICPRRRCIG